MPRFAKLSSDGPLPLLCVSDHFDVQKKVAYLLTRYGFEVVTASYGIDAMMQFRGREGEFSVLLVDNDSAERKGLTLIKHAREIGFRGFIVVLAGHLSPQDCRAYLGLGVCGIFNQPCENGLLATLLTQHR